MIHHPMLLMRDPPPEIDVTRPAWTKRIYVDGFFVASTPTTIEFTTVMDPNSWSVESAAQASNAEGVCTEERKAVAPVEEPVAADFKAGVHPGMKLMARVPGCAWVPRVRDGAPLDKRVEYREATPDELALHWPEVLP